MGKLYKKGTSLSTVIKDREKFNKKQKKKKAKVTEKNKKIAEKNKKIADTKRYGFDTKDMDNVQIADKMIENIDKHYNKINETIDKINESESETDIKRKRNLLSISYRKLLDESQVLDSLQNTNTNYNNAIEAVYKSFPESGQSSADKGVREYHKQNIIRQGLPVNVSDIGSKDEVEEIPGPFAGVTPLMDPIGKVGPHQINQTTKPLSKKEKRINELLKVIQK